MPNNLTNKLKHVASLKRRALLCALLTCAFCLLLSNSSSGQRRGRSNPQPQPRVAPTPPPISEEIMLRILSAEDERRWDQQLAALLTDRDARVRRRAALAAGRIGNADAVESLVSMLRTDADMSVRAMAAFALGEIEAPAGTDDAITALIDSETSERSHEGSELRVRVIEAMGKIAAALPQAEGVNARLLGGAILDALRFESGRNRAQANREVSLAGLTAALRAKPDEASTVIINFLGHTDERVRADAANALARLRAKNANTQLRTLLMRDTDAIVRANAARALGAAEDQASSDLLLQRALNDTDSRVRVSAIRSLGALKSASAAAPLLERAKTLFNHFRNSAYRPPLYQPVDVIELLEITTSLGRILAGTNNQDAVAWLRDFRAAEAMTAPEIEIAFARIAPAAYLRDPPLSRLSDQATHARLESDWRVASSLAQGLSEIAGMTAAAAGNGIVFLQADAQTMVRSLLNEPALPAPARSDVLRSLAAFKPADLAEILRKELKNADVIVRANAADMLGDLQPDEANARALIEALPAALRDEMNDAALAILDSLAKQKTAKANDAIKTALDSQDHLIRRRAVERLRETGAGDFSARIGIVKTRNTVADYRRALARSGKLVRAVINTTKGSFTIELLPDDAPLTVDNFVQLAERHFFDNLPFHRVVPNFVIQGGDPRGDGNGGPGQQIRCEINEVPYERGAVGMALSGKDTGGSQWFVTHAPQPHLDGGYTVFGRVTDGMDVVDQIARGDRILSVTITEGARPASNTTRTPRVRQ
ncbi:MAG TPA: peptidylprolyl isomerase [Pyrinomonadaceae bacterium]|nr:peptidylprolyl isomerase [Pyrinomonadaceae bacterium]